MLTLTSEYAIRAMIYLAQHQKEWPITAAKIASQAGIPGKYLSKILRDLVRFGVLDSSPGRSGGFWLRHAAWETNLQDVVSPFEQFHQRRCPFGNQHCGDERACQAHHRWKTVVAAESRFLRRTSIHDVAARRQDRRRSISKRRANMRGAGTTRKPPGSAG